MPPDSCNCVKNRLLASLPPEEYEQLAPYLEPISLNLKRELYQPNVPIEFVYFPLGGVVSLLSLTTKGELVEVATVGKKAWLDYPYFWGASNFQD